MKTSPDIPQWITSFAAFLTALGAIIGVYFKFKPRIMESTEHSKKTMKGVEINRAINTILSGVENVGVVSVFKIVPSDADPAIPKTFQCLFATDFNTLETWAEPTWMEIDGLEILSNALREGRESFNKKALKSNKAIEWYSSVNCEMTDCYAVGVNISADYSIAVYINYNQERIIRQTERNLIEGQIRTLKYLFKPNGLFNASKWITQHK